MYGSNDDALVDLFNRWTGGYPRMSKYRKAIAAVIGALLITAESVGVDFDADVVEMIPAFTSVIMAILVYALPNKGA